MDFNSLKKIKIFFTVVIATMSELLGVFGILIVFLFCLFALDWLTACMAAVSDNAKVRTEREKQKHGLASLLGLKGIFKKIGYVCAIVLSCILDAVIHTVTTIVNVQMPAKLFFGTLVCAWFVFNEMISILENLDRSGVELPFWLTRVIKGLKINLDKKAEETVDSVIKTEDQEEQKEN